MPVPEQERALVLVLVLVVALEVLLMLVLAQMFHLAPPRKSRRTLPQVLAVCRTRCRNYRLALELRALLRSFRKT